MKQREGNQPHVSALDAQQTRRKPYKKPAVRFERVFETRALSCGKIGSTQGSCQLQHKNS